MTLETNRLRHLATQAADRAEKILAAAQEVGRDLTKSENDEIDTHMAAHQSFSDQAKREEDRASSVARLGMLGAFAARGGMGTLKMDIPSDMTVMDGNGRRLAVSNRPRQFSSAYVDDFYSYMASGGHNVSAALYEGSSPAGGYTVPVVVEGHVVPLAPPDTGVRSVAMIIPTVMDIKIPTASTISTATAKAEGDGTGSNLFTESDPTLAQFTLSAYMAGILHTISFELAQDVPTFQQFAVSDMLLAATLYEENLFINGTGTGQAQGLKGNTAAGVTGVATGSDGYASELLTASYTVQGLLKGSYFPNASWLMNRSTGVLLRKSQMQANLFVPVWTRENGRDLFHGFPVVYSTSMDAVGAAKTPVIFGDFQQGYVIGDRGGSGLVVKILDQPRATEGLIVLLAYRRMDARVRRSEALQAISLT